MPNGSIEVLWLLTLGTSSHYSVACIQLSKYFPGNWILLFNREAQGIFIGSTHVHRFDEYKANELHGGPLLRERDRRDLVLGE